MKLKKVIIGTSYLFLVQMVNYIFPLLLIPFLISKSNISEFGTISVYQNLTLMATTIIDYGFNFTATKKVAEAQSSRERFDILSNVLCVKILLFFVVLIPFIIYICFDKFYLYGLISILIVLTNTFMLNWFFQGIGEISYFSKVSIFSKLISLFPCFLLIKSTGDLYIYLLSILFSNILILLFLLFKLVRLIEINYPIINLYTYLSEGFHVFLSRVSVILYTSAIPVIIRGVLGDYSAGIYIAVDKIVKGVSSLQTPLLQAAYPFVIKYEVLREKINFLFLIPFILYSLFFIFNLFFPRIILMIFHIPLNEISFLCLKILSFQPLLISISGFLGVYNLLAKGKNFAFSLSIISGAFFSTVSLLILYVIKDSSLHDYAFIAVISEFIVCFSMLLFLRKYKKCS